MAMVTRILADRGHNGDINADVLVWSGAAVTLVMAGRRYDDDYYDDAGDYDCNDDDIDGYDAAYDDAYAKQYDAYDDG